MTLSSVPPVSNQPTPKSGTLQSAGRVLAVLDALALHPGGATPKSISADLGLHLSTTYHLLNTLVASGYAVQDPTSRLFRLGSRIPLLYDILLGALRPPPRLRAFVRAAQQATGETTQLWRWWGDDVVAAEVVEGERPDSIPGSAIGLPCAPHALAVGLVLLAWAPAELVASCLVRPEPQRHPALPAPNPLALRDTLDRVRALGYAIDRGSISPAVYCIAAPIAEQDGTVDAAIAVLVPRQRFQREEAALIGTIVGMAQAASAAIRVPISAAPRSEIDARIAAEAAWRATARDRCPRQAALRPRRLLAAAARPPSRGPHSSERDTRNR